jgi:hypothetical protein
VFVLKTRKPYDANKIRQLLKGDNPQQLNGRTYYQVSQIAGNPIPAALGFLVAKPYVCLASDRVVVLAFVSPGQVSDVFVAEGARPRLPDATQALMRRVDRSGFWAVVATDGLIAQHLQKLRAEDLARTPELKPIVKPLQTAKAFLFRVDYLTSDKVRYGVGLLCADDAGARQAASAVKNFWNSKTVQDGMDQVNMVFGRNRAMQAALDEFKGSLAFTSDGPTAWAEFEFSAKVLEDVQKEMQKFGGRNPFIPFGN